MAREALVEPGNRGANVIFCYSVIFIKSVLFIRLSGQQGATIRDIETEMTKTDICSTRNNKEL